MTVRAAPYFPVTIGTGDGVTKDFTIPFPFLDAAHLRIFQNGVLKTITTQYLVLDAQSQNQAVLRFVTAPTSGHVLKATRNTPINRYRNNPAVSNTDALQARYRMEEGADQRKRLDFYINATDLAAPTAASIVAPHDGYIEKLSTRVVDAAVGTGGAVTVEVDGVAVTGLTVTVANSAAIGSVQQDTPTTPQSTTTKVYKGQTITVTPAAAFATSGALEGFLEIQPADLS